MNIVQTISTSSLVEDGLVVVGTYVATYRYLMLTRNANQSRYCDHDWVPTSQREFGAGPFDSTLRSKTACVLLNAANRGIADMFADSTSHGRHDVL